MELDNWEKRIQEIQQKKEATPSLETRTRLNSLLDKDEERGKRNKKIWWSAAAILIFLMVSISILKTKYSGATDEGAFVQTPEKEVKKNTERGQIQQLSKEEKVVSVVLDSPQVMLKEMFISKIEFPVIKKLPEVNDAEGILGNEVVMEADTVYLIDAPNSAMKEYVKAADLLAWVGGQKSKDSLFNFENENTIYVSSDSLLIDSEKELFEDENGAIFHRIGKGLKKLKTNVANRNYK
ncbi:hypothetical protein SAMN05216480_103215 [Pustulibacterium marinum]|uniref:Uncharacterized protein n=1 Tax=Pustulibacterium marinum TaxID=1224947 RepID=A0A1I7G5W0_9FLAO|nr:hypothetical protein [Pustulibacterium marinum]SFU43850.1 hypothetical protein SAMN05216480_103215 [Pustulibacterium marinum]